MSSSRTSSVRSQLRLTFAIIIVLSFVSTAVAIWRLQVLANDTRALTERPLATERLISSWLTNTSVGVKRTAVITRAADPGLGKLYAEEARESTARVGEMLKKVGELLDTPEERAMLGQIAALRQKYTEVRNQVAALKAEGKDEEARALFDQAYTPAADTYVAKANELLSMQQRAIDARVATVLASANRSSDILIALCVATLVFSVLAGAVFVRALFRRLGGEPSSAAAVASEIAAGNLRVAVPLRAGDQDSLMATLERMRASLADIVGQVRHGATSIGASIATMAGETQDLSQRTESQASALEETASSMEELTQTVGHSASSAEQANRLAADAADVARQGGAMVGQLVDTMGAIDASSARIVDIISVIDGIAFQTNILALNAAVEAARAGEQGRGFAVVAAEVRALAQRSAGAAKEIKDLIDASTRRVAQGSTLAGQAGDTMQGIVDGIARVSGIMNEIVSSSREQASGIAQVNQAIVQMDGTTQQNAALVEASAAATRSMQEQASQLARVVALFQIDGVAPAPQPVARTAVPVKTAPALAAVRPAPATAAAAAAPAAPRKTAVRREAVAGSGDWEEF
ncbi:methyl-accepting chemotaxis protein [Massilia phyllosphaerae]|uniref:methyl-accepting chemotaxis protein n=1 Tax=Massilia phyllosphaerae TaxID=3106034 RepID=UPI002B1CD43A|nr:methyl-accepting chemotaxis protein [Massilia sp. SGZ-792]